LIEHKVKVVKNKTNEFINKLTSSKLIVYNNILHKPTNMTIFKCLKIHAFRLTTSKLLIESALDQNLYFNLN